MVDSFFKHRLLICSILYGIILIECVKGDTTYFCDFEEDQCGYVRDNNEVARWNRNFGPSWMRSTKGTTGPATDHTPGASTGFYMVLLNIPNLYVYDPGDKARITSPCYPASRTVDVTFYYHMYGDGIGQLNVFLADCSLTTSVGLSVINILGDQGDEWMRAGFSQANVNDFKLVFEAVRGPTNNSDIAIDDITIKRTEPELNTDPQDYLNEADVVCTFEGDACGYEQDETDDTNMVYNHGASWLRLLDGSTGPTADHTSGIETNLYMILLNVPGVLDLQPGDTARLISPCYTIATWVRILFFYHMYGEGMGTLNVYSSNCGSVVLNRKIFSISGNQGDEWKSASSIVFSENGIKFTFEAIRGPEQSSDIAIDDIALYAVDDEDITTTTEKTTTVVTEEVITTQKPIQTTVTNVPPTTQQKVTTAEVTEPLIVSTEVINDPCDPNPCQNQGGCTVDSEISYTCACTAQWTGDNCGLAVQKAEATEDDTSGGFTTINIVAIVLACVAVIVLLGCFVVFGCRGRDTGETKRKTEPPSYERARQLQEQLQGRQIHLPKTKQTYQQKQQLIEEEKRRQLEEQRRHEEAERLRRQRLRELQEKRERELQEQLAREEEQDEQLYTVKNQISFDSIEDEDATNVRPPLRKQQSSGRKLPKLPTNQNYV